MANNLKISAVGLASLLAAAAFAQTATTTPVGFVKFTVPAATSASAPSVSYIGFPMINESVSSALLTAVGTTTLSVAGSPWSVSPSPEFLAGPFLVRVVSGTGAGHCFLITGQTANTLTVNPRGAGDLTAIVAVGDRIEVTPADTIGTLFGTPTFLQGGTSASNGDNVQIRTAGGWDTYFYSTSASQWQKGFTPANSTVVFPDQAIVIVRRATTPVDLISVGQVPVSKQQSLIAGPGVTALVNRFPVPTTLVNLGLQNLPNWKKGSSASNSDTVQLRTAGGWTTYFFSSSTGKWQNGFTDASNTVVDVSTGILIARQSAASGSAALLSNSLPY